MDWYKTNREDVLENLDTDIEKGLSNDKIASLMEKYGKNSLKEKKKKSMATKLKEQFLDPMIIILLFASILSIAIGEITDSLIIIAIVIVNALLSIYQEGKAEQAIEALQKMASPKAKVIRDGQVQHIDSKDLLPGDVVELETGDIIPADLRLIESTNLKIDESSLTGESVSVEKNANDEITSDVSIGDRTNMAYSSSIVSYGRAKGVVVEIGQNTEIGKIATSLSEVEDEQTPLQRKLAQLSKQLGIITIVVCAIVFAVGYFLYDFDALNMLMTAVSLAVAAIPEGLPAIVTIVLSLGMGRMADKNAIVKKLLAVETLGTTTVICSDKTGTLTQNEMTVKKIHIDGKDIDVTGTGYKPEGEYLIDDKKIQDDDVKSLKTLLNIMSLTNDSKLIEDDGLYKIIGDPTEGALHTAAGKQGITKEMSNEKYPRVEEIPFDSERKMMTTFHDKFSNHKLVSFTKGAPDIIIEKCSHILIDGEIKPFTEQLKQKLLDKNSEYAKQALRVLAYAFREHDDLPSEINSDTVEKNMVFVGLSGMIDPPRLEVKDAIKECKTAGITPIMITGDYLETAVAIAKDLGICTDDSQAIMGSELNDMTDDEIREIVKVKRVYARVSPQNKVQIVKALKENGHIAAMTGDGVNDAPAIKKADIGIAMGITGTDVAKNTSEVILTDDNFATIVHAVEEGRIIYSNIKKFVSFLLSCNIAEILIVFLAIMFKWDTPFIPIQLLWLNLVTDSFPAMALGVEKGETDIMNRNPRSPKEPIIDKNMRISIAVQSIAITIATLFAYHYGLNHFDGHIESARTVAFATLILSELLRSYSVRSDNKSVFQIGVFSNKALVMGTSLSLAMMLAVIYIPGVNKVFETIPLHIEHYKVILPCAFLPFVAGEIFKSIKSKN
ncbi:calcium-translocating P-type ATPase, SERCA-type [uncultured Finegoldia sp.]|uniref:calcium-translocating P-type ATPase, SERCA-type n=1 Tax=uncultured Finegoldia sp. TaxID=328009 RepID=UPI00261DD63E|nr:calcium-translocating P-type ATPase, SERCA-type [uncultured Finegoldia sp.]